MFNFFVVTSFKYNFFNYYNKRLQDVKIEIFF